MTEWFIRLLDLYKQGASQESERATRELLTEARMEQDRLSIAGEDISNITRFISEVEYLLYDHYSN